MNFKSIIKAHSQAVSDKIKKLMDEGKPQDQAIAIALDMEKRGELGKSLLVKKKKMPKGPYYGPGHGGKIGVYADPQHKIAYDEKKHGYVPEEDKQAIAQIKARGWADRDLAMFLNKNPSGVTAKQMAEKFGGTEASQNAALQGLVKQGKLEFKYVKASKKEESKKSLMFNWSSLTARRCREQTA